VHFLNEDTDSAVIERREPLSSPREENVNKNGETVTKLEIINYFTTMGSLLQVTMARPLATAR